LSILIQILVLCFSGGAFGAIHPNMGSHQKSPLFFENARELVTKPQTQERSEGFYNAYFGNLDGKISLLYQDQWRFHDQNLPFRSSSWRGEFISNSSASGSVTYDWQERENFAKQVLRMRVEQGVREYLKTFKHSDIVAKAQGTIESVQNMSIASTTDSKGSKAQLRLGYDLFSDSSKLEYVGGAVNLGVYKSKTLSKPTDQSSAQMTVSTELGETLGRASVSVPLSAEQVQTTLSKQLSPTVATSLSSTQPLQPRQNSSYYWNVAFSF